MGCLDSLPQAPSSPPTDTRRPRVLVTGASGKIGRHVVAELRARNYSVRALTSRPLTPALTADPGLEWRRLDFLAGDPLSVNEHVAGCAAVLHLAAEIWDIPKMPRVNVEATAALAAAAERAGAAFFGFTSSAAVHGSPITRLVTEESPLVTAERDVRAEFRGTRSIRAYARSKVLGERAIQAHAARVEYVVFRPTVVVDLPAILAIGDRGSIARFVLGDRHEHFVYVRDVARAMLWFMERALARPVPRPGVTTYTLSDDEAARTTGRSFLEYAYARTGDERFRPTPSGPDWLYDVCDLAKNGAVSRRLPFGLARYPSAKLRATGYRHLTGIDGAQALALDRLGVRTTPHDAGLAVGRPSG